MITKRQVAKNSPDYEMSDEEALAYVTTRRPEIAARAIEVLDRHAAAELAMDLEVKRRRESSNAHYSYKRKPRT